MNGEYDGVSKYVIVTAQLSVIHLFNIPFPR